LTIFDKNAIQNNLIKQYAVEEEDRFEERDMLIISTPSQLLLL
jgi:hypothetical protein